MAMNSFAAATLGAFDSLIDAADAGVLIRRHVPIRRL
ncbi:MAG: hypothetical protein ACI8V5_004596, partial [Limisphaerales bacterium]